MKFLDWNKDKWKSTNGTIIRYDKLEHFLLAFIGLLITYMVTYYFEADLNIYVYEFVVWELIGIGYEIYNGCVAYDGVHIEGFSSKDLLADNYGFIAAVIVFLISLRLYFMYKILFCLPF